MPMRAFRLVSWLALAAFAAVLGVQSLALSGVTRVYPSVFIVATLLGALVMAARELLLGGTGAAVPSDIARLARLHPGGRARFAGFVALWLCYPWLLTGLGFLVATTLAVFASLWLLAIARPLRALVGSAVFALALALLFATVFYIPTPEGPADAWLGHLLYVLSR